MACSYLTESTACNKRFCAIGSVRYQSSAMGATPAISGAGCLLSILISINKFRFIIYIVAGVHTATNLPARLRKASTEQGRQAGTQTAESAGR